MFCSKKNFHIENIYQKINDLDIHYKNNHNVILQSFQELSSSSISFQNDYLKEIFHLKNQINILLQELNKQNLEILELKNELLQNSSYFIELKSILLKEKRDIHTQCDDFQEETIVQVEESVQEEETIVQVEEIVPQKKKRTYNRKKAI